MGARFVNADVPTYCPLPGHARAISKTEYKGLSSSWLQVSTCSHVQTCLPAAVRVARHGTSTDEQQIKYTWVPLCQRIQGA